MVELLVSGRVVLFDYTKEMDVLAKRISCESNIFHTLMLMEVFWLSTWYEQTYPRFHCHKHQISFNENQGDGRHPMKHGGVVEGEPPKQPTRNTLPHTWLWPYGLGHRNVRVLSDFRSIVCQSFPSCLPFLRNLKQTRVTYIIIYLKDQKILVLRDRHDLLVRAKKPTTTSFWNFQGVARKSAAKKENFGPRSCYIFLGLVYWVYWILFDMKVPQMEG